MKTYLPPTANEHRSHRTVPTLPAMRGFLTVATALVVMAGFQLFVLTEHTDRFFAWTIDSPITAASFGAGYWAAACLEWLSAKEGHWAAVRAGIPVVLLFTTLTTIVTFLHLDRFHLDSVFGWAWLVVYCVVPPVMVALLVRQRRVPSEDPPIRVPIAPWARVTLLLQASGLLVAGIALLVVPLRVASWWPWGLTPLTGRATGAWLVGIAALGFSALREGDWSRLRPGAAGFLAFGSLQLVAIARYPDQVFWGRWGTWAYLAILASALVLGAYGWRASRGTPPTAVRPVTLVRAN